MNLLWCEIDILAEEFCLPHDEFEEIASCLHSEMCITRSECIQLASRLFNALDTDRNGLVDALEFYGVLLVLSAVRLEEILIALLSAFDFDGTQSLCFDEVMIFIVCYGPK